MNDPAAGGRGVILFKAVADTGYEKPIGGDKSWQK